MLLVAAVLLLSRIPPISYDRSILLDHKESFEMAAAVCMEYYHQDAANDDPSWLCELDENVDHLMVHRGKEYTFSSEQKQAFQTVKSVFHVDRRNLKYIYVNDNFVVFGVDTGRASFIFSLSDERPSFVNAPISEDDDIFVQKMDDHWYYACWS